MDERNPLLRDRGDNATIWERGAQAAELLRKLKFVGHAADIEQLVNEHHALKGTVHVLADKLAKFTGRTVPQEIRDAEQ